MSEQQLGLRAQPKNEKGVPPDWAPPVAFDVENANTQPTVERAAPEVITAYTLGAKVVANSGAEWYKVEDATEETTSEEPSELTTVEYHHDLQQPTESVPRDELLATPIVPQVQSVLPTAAEQMSDW